VGCFGAKVAKTPPARIEASYFHRKGETGDGLRGMPMLMQSFLQTVAYGAKCTSMKLCAQSAKSPKSPTELQLLLVLQEAKSRCDNERY
jgi:hypothetical protein